MTDLITRARKEWCEPSLFKPHAPHHLEAYHWVKPCPPEVVAALLDVVEQLNEFDVRMSQGGHEALRAEAAITRALEGK
jgi:hypothetical protein